MITSIRLFGIEVFRLERLSVLSDEQFVALGLADEVDEDTEPDITAQTYGFGPPSQYL